MPKSHWAHWGGQVVLGIPGYPCLGWCKMTPSHAQWKFSTVEVPSTDEGAEVRFRRGSCYQGTEVVSFQNMIPGWWFQTFLIFHNIWDNPSHWLLYFSRWVKPPTRSSSVFLIGTFGMYSAETRLQVVSLMTQWLVSHELMNSVFVSLCFFLKPLRHVLFGHTTSDYLQVTSGVVIRHLDTNMSWNIYLLTSCKGHNCWWFPTRHLKHLKTSLNKYLKQRCKIETSKNGQPVKNNISKKTQCFKPRLLVVNLNQLPITAVALSEASV